MNHPQPQEWVPYVFGETAADARGQLSAHLRDCAECRAQVEGWQRSLQRLDAWQLPPANRRPSRALPVLKWAAAAMVLGLSFGLGRFSTPKPDLERLRAAIEPGLRQEMRQEVAQLLRVELDQLESQRVTDYLALKKDLDTVAVLTDAGLRDTRQRLVQLANFTTPTTSPELQR